MIEIDIPSTLLVRAKVNVWNLKKAVYEPVWCMGYLAPLGISHWGAHFGFMTKAKGNCIYLAGDEFAYNTKSYDDSQIVDGTIGRYTGLKDKNNKKIFEGDIVKTKYGRLCIMVWFQSPVHCGWDFDPILTAENCRLKPPTPYDLFYSVNLEVVGNIHDNPELLEKET